MGEGRRREGRKGRGEGRRGVRVGGREKGREDEVRGREE